MFGMQRLHAKVGQTWPLVNLKDDYQLQMQKIATNTHLWFCIPIHSSFHCFAII